MKLGERLACYFLIQLYSLERVRRLDRGNIGVLSFVD